MERGSDFKACKAHPDERGDYYVTTEPWNKFCKTCALNRAICGYKIEKDLTPQEFQNKIMLSSVVHQLKLAIETCQKQSNNYSQFIEKINNQLLGCISPMIKIIDNHIKELVQVKNQILEVYDTQVHQKLNKCHQIQNRYFMDSINFKRELDNLETNYCDIIVDSKDGSDEMKHIASIKAQIERSRKTLQEKIYIEEHVSNALTQFENKFKEFDLKVHSFNLPSVKSPLPITERQLNAVVDDNRTSINPIDQKIFLTHRKKSNLSSSICGQENKYSPRFTSRPTNLTLKPTKRTNSIPLRNKVFRVLEG